MVTRRNVAALAVLALAALAGCGGQAGPGVSGATGTTKLTLIQGVKGDEFYTTMACGAQEEARKLGVELEVTGADRWDAALQLPVINAVTAKKPDAVLVAPVDATAMARPLKQMQDNGSKVVLVDTVVDDTSVGVSRISSDNEQGGRRAAEALARLMGEKGSVLVISVKAGVSTTDARVKGFREELARHPGITFIGVRYNDDDPAKAASIVTSTLAARPDLGGIFAANLLTAEGAATGLKNTGKQGQVKIAAFDAAPKQVEDLENGTLQVLVAQDPYRIGQEGVRQAVAAVNGRPPTARISTDLVAITAENLDDPQVRRHLYKSTC